MMEHSMGERLRKQRERLTPFLDELSALSEKHGFVICGIPHLEDYDSVRGHYWVRVDDIRLEFRPVEGEKQ